MTRRGPEWIIWVAGICAPITGLMLLASLVSESSAGKNIIAGWFGAKGLPILFLLSNIILLIALVWKNTLRINDSEQKLKASLAETNRLKIALDEHAIVAITDSHGKIIYANDKFCTISKYSREELIGQDHRIINSHYHPREFMRDLWTTIAHGKVWQGEVKNQAKDGSYYWVATTIVPFIDEQGKPKEYVAIRADITQRKSGEEQIRHLNADLEHRVAERTAQLESANKELEAFSYSVSHDLRSPLRILDGVSQVLMEDYSSQLPEKANHYLATLRHKAQQMAQLIEDLLAFSRLGRTPLKKQIVDMHELVSHCLNDLADQHKDRNMDIRVGDLPACNGDRPLLQQVWINLISNAFKYTRYRDPAVIEIGCTPVAGENVYYVRDNGAGFDMRDREKIFGVFQRLHHSEEYEGTGIGLAIVQRIIHRHGGHIRAEAQLNAGATFYFSIDNQTSELKA